MKGFRKLGVLGAVVAASILFAVEAPVLAAGSGAQAVAERQAVMKSIGAHMGGLKGALMAGNGKAVAMHAGAINGLAKVLVGFFPKGSGPEAGVKTRALPKIWQDWANFKKVPTVLAAESGKLVQVAKSGGDAKAMMAQFGKMAKMGCGGCHKPYRAPKK